MKVDVNRIEKDIAREIVRNGTSIVLTWEVWPPDSAVDPTDGSHSGTSTPGTATLKAFVHYVQVAGRSGVRQFNEVEQGDVILDFAADVDLTGKDNLRFNVKGQFYVAKQLSDRLATTWDVTVQDKKLFRTVLVRKAT